MWSFENVDRAYRVFEPDNPAAVFDETDPGAADLPALGFSEELGDDAERG